MVTLSTCHGKAGGTGRFVVHGVVAVSYTHLDVYKRQGMGFAFMEAFMDDLDVESEPGKGTLVKMEKKLGTLSWTEDDLA